MLPSQIDSENFVYLVAQEPFHCLHDDEAGHSWIICPYGGDDPQSRTISEGMILEATERVVERLACAREGVALMGFSQGAALATTLAVSRRLRFNKVLLQNGWANHDAVRACAEPPLGQTNFLIQHGIEDDRIPIEVARNLERFLRDLGANVMLREYEVGHAYCKPMLADAAEFLRGSPPFFDSLEDRACR
jgi:predicted esterase